MTSSGRDGIDRVAKPAVLCEIDVYREVDNDCAMQLLEYGVKLLFAVPDQNLIADLQLHYTEGGARISAKA